jgi:cytochrome P450
MDRPRPRDHLAFGTGPHVCPGASLARLETVVVLETLCDRVANLALVDGFVPIPNPVFWALGHRSLPVTLTPLSDGSTR